MAYSLLQAGMVPKSKLGLEFLTRKMPDDIVLTNVSTKNDITCYWKDVAELSLAEF